jgi:tRNA(Ile)-lysidine synthetase-like protein
MILSTVRRTIRERALVSPGDHVLVACSGGPDSITLLHVLHRLRSELGVTICAASIDHGLRPDSASEVGQVGAFAGTLGVPFYSACVEVPRQGASIQARARELRYRALQEIAHAHHAIRVAVGHTQDDQAETVVARLLRGSGLRGLGGIEARRSDGVIRPLLDCRRSDVRSYAVDRQLPFVDDPSNHQRVNAYLDAHVPELPPAGDRLVATELLTELAPPTRVRWLRSWIAQETGLTPNRRHLTEVGRLVTAQGEVLLGSGWSVCRQSGGLLLEYREHRRTRSNRS